MKKLKISLLLLFAVFSFSANIVFAQSTVGDPMPGVPVGLEGDPPVGVGIPNVKTDANGKFACKLPEGKYKLMISYNDIASILSHISSPGGYVSTSPGSYIVTLLLGQMPTIKAPASVTINRGARPISILVAKGGGTLNGTLTYTKVK